MHRNDKNSPIRHAPIVWWRSRCIRIPAPHQGQYPIMNSFANDVFQCFAVKTNRLAHYNKCSTAWSRDPQTRQKT
ncbi:unnamed protein product [Gongylonema pulchrum]|uniref:Uncharacterized protein n=1 Tax=Gongylonema pulchrum TaxID=637853 RepID=A0A183CZF0_9BILA|nr:unnamed protein product [Gongylonema pulchrum]